MTTYCGWCVNSVSINTPHSYKAHFTAIYWSSFDAFIYQKNITSNKSMFTCFWTSLPCSTSARLSSKLVVSLGIGSRSLLLLWYYVYSRAIDICIYYVNFVYSEEPLDCWVRTKRRLKVITSVLYSCTCFLWYLILIIFVECKCLYQIAVFIFVIGIPFTIKQIQNLLDCQISSWTVIKVFNNMQVKYLLMELKLKQLLVHFLNFNDIKWGNSRKDRSTHKAQGWNKSVNQECKSIMNASSFHSKLEFAWSESQS